jgi:hypothetical protein
VDIQAAAVEIKISDLRVQIGEGMIGSQLPGKPPILNLKSEL